MPNDVFSSTVELMGYNELLSYATEQTGLPTATVIGRVNGELRTNYYSPTLSYDERHSQALANWLGKQGFNVSYNGDGKWAGSAFSTTAEVVTPSIVDSNNVTVNRGLLRQMYGNAKEWDGTAATWQISKFPASGGLGAKALYTIGSVGGAISAASTGITLGKTIAPALYDAAPNFWNSIGITDGSFDPENWATLTNGDDSPFAGLFNLILGIDPDTGETQAYMNESAFAYMAYAMKQGGVFDPTVKQATSIDGSLGQLNHPEYFNFPISFTNPPIVYQRYHNNEWENYFTSSIVDSTSEVRCLMFAKSDLTGISTTPACVSRDYFRLKEVTFSSGSVSYRSPSTYTINGETFYVIGVGSWYGTGTYRVLSNFNVLNTTRTPDNTDCIRICFGSNISESGGIEGINNQDGATLPDVSNWNDIPSTLQSLQNQYPDLWNDGMAWNSDDPKSNTYGDLTRYIPVAMPNFNYNNSQQPVSSTSTQASPQLNPTISDATLLKAITEAIQATKTQTQSETEIPPQNPVTTGTGEPPALVPPSGSASALWSVYHPTQAQVNSFGAWLWTDNIITQIQQLLQNPMEGIITLHKVFAPPVDSGQGTIVVGRLDSNVPSATVNQQYVTVDCGEIDCLEQFGNVFDYSPFTSISIYLPFIGIAPLSVNDIMRSKIHVTYGVDVFTGVCLAMIEVSRDGNTVNMYQYAGVASVEYPLTGTVHNGLITGIMGIVGGFATIATAGAAAPVASAGGVAAAGAGALATGRQSQSRSGNFSGNAGAMGIKTPYLIIERPQTKVADTFPELAGYPTNKSLVLRECSGHVVVKHVHIEGVNATQGELIEIENLLQSGVLV